MTETIYLTLESVYENDVLFSVHGKLAAEIKAAATYYDQDYLDDMDEFDIAPGWYIAGKKVASLITPDRIAKINGQEFNSAEQLLAFYNPIAIKQRQAEAKALAEERQRQEQAQREEAGKLYEAWKTSTLMDLSETTANPPRDLIWQEIRREPRTTPGTWYDTGDQWSMATINEQPVYRCYYGNAVIYYAAETLVKSWVTEIWNAIPDAEKPRRATEVLLGYVRATEDEACYGDDQDVQLVGIFGIDYFISIARQHTTFIQPYYRRELAIAQRFGIPYVQFKKSEYSREHSKVVFYDDQGRAWVTKPGTVEYEPLIAKD